MGNKKWLVNILVIEECVGLYEALTRRLDGLLPKNANVVCCKDFNRGLDDLRELGFFHIVVLGTTASDTDESIARRLNLIRQAARRQPKLALFAASPPIDPAPLRVHHIVQKTNMPELALAITLIMQGFSRETLEGWMTS